MSAEPIATIIPEVGQVWASKQFASQRVKVTSFEGGNVGFESNFAFNHEIVTENEFQQRFYFLRLMEGKAGRAAL